jgi:hypothetical protein
MLLALLVLSSIVLLSRDGLVEYGQMMSRSHMPVSTEMDLRVFIYLRPGSVLTLNIWTYAWNIKYR